MPNLFLSPSVQQYNPYINGLGSEEYYMNLIADAMEPYLVSSRHNFHAQRSGRYACAGDCSIQCRKLRFSSGPPFQRRSSESRRSASRAATSTITPPAPKAQRAAEIFAENLKVIYPDPDLVRTVANTTLGELRLDKSAVQSDRAGLPRQSPRMPCG